ncbi:MAG: hypothetical protein KH901_06525 [Streptococcus vestibularis]|jgi:hypothetical protein|uniref:DUF6287 domain-containing protein n=1 Tax=Streptococcus vestibularis TaxID=1343 RepID=A0A943LTG7_STRVE|nr:DUF6287 domain-containing protein [Streptococcus vestibularis]MBS6098094.1 hypothetical protein [Streptococcus vestibularis]
MKTTTKLIGILSALIVVILAIFLVTKFNSHESARVSSSSSPARTVKKSSSSSSKAVKKDKKAAQSSAAVSSKENDNQASAVAPKASSQKQAQAETTDGGQVAGTDKAKSEKGTINSQSSLNFGALDNGDISSIVGTWTNANGESVTINADGTIIKNSTGYTAQLKPQGVSDNTFNASVVSQDDSVALSAVAGVSGNSDYIVIGANGPYYRN